MDKTLLHGDDIVGQILTITHIEKYPSQYNTKEMCPFVTFAEFPNCHYEAGVMIRKNVDRLANEVGEASDTIDYPKLNATLAELGGIRAYFEWKNSEKSRNRRYINMILC